jgi:flagellar protein FlbD
MIKLTRLNKKPLMVNSDLIMFIENAPDTVITLITGEKIVVCEKGEQVIERILDFRRHIAPEYRRSPALREVGRTEAAEVLGEPPDGVERGQE